MKDGWTFQKISDVCEVVNGGTPKTGVDEYWNGHHLWITPAEMGKLASPYVSATKRMLSDAGLANSSARIMPANSIILSSRAPIGHLVINTKPMATNQGCKGLVPKEVLDHKFLYYFLSGNVDLLNSLGTGATFKELSATSLKDVRIPVPPIEEQRRIVAILDEAFACIDKAKANTEKNIQNARELFDSCLNNIFSNPGPDWEERTFGECFRLKSGEGLTSKTMVEGPFFVYGGNGISGTHNESNLEGSNVIIGRVGALCGNVRNITETIWLTDNAFRISDFKFGFDHKFLTYLLNFKDLRSLARQSAQPVISNSSLADLRLQFPSSVLKQEEIVKQFDALSSHISELENKYRRQLDKLDETRKAVLQKAFSGDL